MKNDEEEIMAARARALFYECHGKEVSRLRAKLAEAVKAAHEKGQVEQAESDSKLIRKMTADFDSLRADLSRAEAALANAHTLLKSECDDWHKHAREWCNLDDARRRATTGGDQYVPPTHYEKVVNMGPTPTSASGDPPSPAAPDFELRIDAVCLEVWNAETRDHDVRTLASHALQARDEAKRLRAAIQRALKTVFHDIGETRYQLSCALAAQPEAGRRAVTARRPVRDCDA